MGPQLRAVRYNIAAINDAFQGALNWAMMPRDVSLLAGSTPDVCKSPSPGVIVAASTLAMFVSILSIVLF